jgi:YggT family protein
MLIIERTLWFFNWAISIVIIAVIVLMILRLIADQMDLNPFGWTSRTIRRLTDTFVIPVRGGLRNFGGMNPDFAPLVVILITILMGYFVSRLMTTIAETFAGVLNGVQRGAMIMVVGYILYGFLSIYILLIIIRIIFSWGQTSYRNRVMRFLFKATEPLLGPLRRMIPLLGWLDISPLVAILILMLFQAAVAGTLLSTGSFRTF